MTNVFSKKWLVLLVLLIIFLALLAIPDFVFAQEVKYSPIVKIPGVSDSTTGGIGSLVNALFLIGLVVTASLATIMLAIGGLQYMTTDAVYGKSEGRERIWNAIFGLLIALLIWVILSEINPNIVSNLNPTIQQTQGVERSGAPNIQGRVGVQIPNTTPNTTSNQPNSLTNRTNIDSYRIPTSADIDAIKVPTNIDSYRIPTSIDYIGVATQNFLNNPSVGNFIGIGSEVFKQFNPF